ncbi:MAG: hypothetical protein AB7G11_08300 [Phycisphaerales bacterium]
MLALRRRIRSCFLSAALACVAAPCLATDLPPGGTLEPIPVMSLPAGAVLERTISQDYDISWVVFPNPIPRHVTGTVTQSIYRLTDNTLLFYYNVTNDSTSQGGIATIGIRDFSDSTTFSTDVSLLNSLVCFNCESADRAVRDIFGSGISFEYDLGIATGYHSRPLVVRTDATSYAVSICGGRFGFGTGRVVVSTGSHQVTLCGFASPVTDATPPIVSITAPSPLANNCNPVMISGTAYDPQGFDQYVLEYATSPNGPWTQISSSTDPVNPAGPLGAWNTGALASGYYFVRLTASNTTALTTSVTSVVYVDRSAPSVEVRSPQTSNIPLGGSVCFDGTVWDTGGSTYTIQYRSLPSGVFAHVNPGTPTYAGQIINDGLGSWTTRSGPAAVADGSYEVRVSGTDACGLSASVTRQIIVDNTAPIGVIASPAPCTVVRGSVNVIGTIADANLASWALQYTGGDASGWVTIASGNNPVNNAVIAAWNTSGLRSCAYTLRLLVGDRSSVNCGSTNNQAEYLTSVFVGCPADFNHDDSVNSQDYFDFLTAFFSPCP